MYLLMCEFSATCKIAHHTRWQHRLKLMTTTKLSQINDLIFEVNYVVISTGFCVLSAGLILYLDTMYVEEWCVESLGACAGLGS